MKSNKNTARSVVENALDGTVEVSELEASRARELRDKMGPLLDGLIPHLAVSFLCGSVSATALSCFAGRDENVQLAVSDRADRGGLGPYRNIVHLLEKLHPEALQAYAEGQLTPEGVVILSRLSPAKQRLVRALAGGWKASRLGWVADGLASMGFQLVCEILDAVECSKAFSRQWVGVKASRRR